MSKTFLACALVTLFSACVSLGFSWAALRSKGEAHLAAMYATSRSVALVFVSFIPFATNSYPALKAIATAMIIVQAGDAYIGYKQKDVMKTAGPAFLATINLAFFALVIIQQYGLR